jgi:transposase
MDRLARLSHQDWKRIAAHLPERSARGGRRAKPHRPVIEAILWILRTGAPWRDLPRAYGPWKSVYTRFRRWTLSGVWPRILAALSAQRDDESFLVDATIVRAHQDASGGAGLKISADPVVVRPRRSMRCAMPSVTR